MNKHEFLSALQEKLSGIPQDDMAERISFYSEMIDDRIENGLTEEQAVAELGKSEDIVQQIVSEVSLTKLVKEKVKPSRTVRAWEIVLLALGSPIWLSLLIALFAVVISVYAVLWSVIISLWAAEASIAVCSVGGAFTAVINITQGELSSGIFMLGAGIICAGLAIFGFFGCRCANIAILKLTKKIFLWIKFCFIKKEAAK